MLSGCNFSFLGRSSSLSRFRAIFSVSSCLIAIGDCLALQHTNVRAAETTLFLSLIEISGDQIHGRVSARSCWCSKRQTCSSGIQIPRASDVYFTCRIGSLPSEVTWPATGHQSGCKQTECLRNH